MTEYPQKLGTFIEDFINGNEIVKSSRDINTRKLSTIMEDFTTSNELLQSSRDINTLNIECNDFTNIEVSDSISVLSDDASKIDTPIPRTQYIRYKIAESFDSDSNNTESTINTKSVTTIPGGNSISTSIDHVYEDYIDEPIYTERTGKKVEDLKKEIGKLAIDVDNISKTGNIISDTIIFHKNRSKLSSDSIGAIEKSMKYLIQLSVFRNVQLDRKYSMILSIMEKTCIDEFHHDHIPILPTILDALLRAPLAQVQKSCIKRCDIL
jgi:hypothetical protein